MPFSQYLARPVRSLRVVCRATGRDDDGRACATCAIRDLCERPAEPQTPR